MVDKQPADVVGERVPNFRQQGFKMHDIMQFLTYHNALPMLAITFGIGVPVVASYWYKLRVKQWEMSLKHTMLERGMSAADIKAVLEASATQVENNQGCGNRGRQG